MSNKISGGFQRMVHFLVGFFAKDGIDTLPEAVFVEGCSSMQHCCPTCAYGIGHCESLLPGLGCHKEIVITCETCGTRYKSLVVGS